MARMPSVLKNNLLMIAFGAVIVWLAIAMIWPWWAFVSGVTCIVIGLFRLADWQSGADGSGMGPWGDSS